MLTLSAQRHISLLDALLRIRNAEERRIRDIRRQAACNALHSTGALASAPYEPQPECDAFSRNFAASVN